MKQQAGKRPADGAVRRFSAGGRRLLSLLLIGALGLTGGCVSYKSISPVVATAKAGTEKRLNKNSKTGVLVPVGRFRTETKFAFPTGVRVGLTTVEQAEYTRLPVLKPTGDPALLRAKQDFAGRTRSALVYISEDLEPLEVIDSQDPVLNAELSDGEVKFAARVNPVLRETPRAPYLAQIQTAAAAEGLLGRTDVIYTGRRLPAGFDYFLSITQSYRKSEYALHAILTLFLLPGYSALDYTTTIEILDAGRNVIKKYEQTAGDRKIAWLPFLITFGLLADNAVYPAEAAGLLLDAVIADYNL